MSINSKRCGDYNATQLKSKKKKKKKFTLAVREGNGLFFT